MTIASRTGSAIRPRRASKRFWSVWRVALPFTILIVLWQAAVAIGNYPAYLFPAPLRVLSSGWEVVLSGQLATHVGAALRLEIPGTSSTQWPTPGRPIEDPLQGDDAPEVGPPLDGLEKGARLASEVSGSVATSAPRTRGQGNRKRR